MPKPTIFISYSRSQNADLARYLYDKLVSWDVDVFLDVESLGGAVHYPAEIEKQIINRDYFLLLLTAETLNSTYVVEEVQIALRHRKPIIPFVSHGFDFYRNIPPNISELKTFNAIFYDFKDPDSAFKRLRKTLGIKRHGWIIALIAVGIMGLFALATTLVASVFNNDGINNTIATDAPSLPTVTMTLNPTVAPTDTIPTPQLTESPVSIRTGYPCEGQIVSSDSDTLFIVYNRPVSRLQPIASVMPETQVVILDEAVEAGRRWYQIEYGEADRTGWVWDRYVVIAQNCSR
jgi:hypothetical protein